MSRIGHIDDFEDDSSASIQVDYLSLLVVKKAGELFLYENRCPHADDTLDPMGGSVASADAMLVVCQRHGAEFLSHNGECVAGPCLGESLRPVPFTLANGDIYLD
ncbi:Rieske (2Fe-2S) protein [Parahaliea mediterranea]|uniref:Rieske 2Fe-2S domain-containing protein n=1 Tax=Parahaliea mediterranea TaxID=651086 RepID=A0A939DDX6_9GAMM|nr:Rieske 2Fe-2S domain-containing protein [Parahaliea mediterranea]MBN7795772.1 Rieske 2Fe-2S domain-containing protein [Parahaliea mediterranea]